MPWSRQQGRWSLPSAMHLTMLGKSASHSLGLVPGSLLVITTVMLLYTTDDGNAYCEIEKATEIFCCQPPFINHGSWIIKHSTRPRQSRNLGKSTIHRERGWGMRRVKNCQLWRKYDGFSEYQWLVPAVLLTCVPVQDVLDVAEAEALLGHVARHAALLVVVGDGALGRVVPHIYTVPANSIT